MSTIVDSAKPFDDVSKPAVMSKPVVYKKCLLPQNNNDCHDFYLPGATTRYKIRNTQDSKPDIICK